MNFPDALPNGIISIVSVPFVIIALVLLVMGLKGRRTAAKSRSWPTTQGVVLGATIEAKRSSSSRGGTSTSYYPVVIYEYQIAGKIYHNNSLSVEGAMGGPAGRAQQKIMQYPAGATVTVHYNPDNPQQSGIEHSTGRSNILIGIAILILVILIPTVVFTMLIFNSVSGLTSGIVK